MSDTPRTDAKVFVTTERAMRLDVSVVAADLARTLERELESVTRSRDALLVAVRELERYFTSTNGVLAERAVIKTADFERMFRAAIATVEAGQ